MSTRYVQPLRILIQYGFLSFMIWLGFSFYQFINFVRIGVEQHQVIRPDGVDGFLPISGLLGTASWIKGNGINSVHPAAMIVFLTVIIVSLLLRRSFCSWICPVATISELSWKCGFGLLHRSWRLPVWFDIALRSLKYILMAFFIYSVVFAMSAEALSDFILSDYHMIADVRLLNFFLNMSPLALGVLLTLAAFSFVSRNPFCRYICPYGALLGLLALLSPLRVNRSRDRCVSCGICNQVCPAYIDVMHKKDIVSPECIACWRCISHCRFNESLSMRVVRRFKISGFIFAVLVVMLFIGGVMIGKLSGHWHSSVSYKEYVRLLGK